MQQTIQGQVYVVGDNVDTDQVIPAEYLNLNPADPTERKQFGRYALSGVPTEQAGLPTGGVPFVDTGDESNTASSFRIVVAGSNFGCGSSREHAPLALHEAGVAAVVAESYARIFFRNSVNGGYVLPCESVDRLIESFRTGDEARIDLAGRAITNVSTGKSFALKPLGDVTPIIEAGGLFGYAKSQGMMPG
ncbi:MAG TPA: 3-isopropylmalate dehydratase [Phycisphaerae bacterium]|nr:3-isopropylmalate dehydratase [Phycisphaerae bacterium]